MNGEKMIDPTKIGQRPETVRLSDAGFEALSGLRPSDEIRPLNPTEIRDLREVDTEGMTLEAVLENLRSQRRIHQEEAEKTREALDKPVQKIAESYVVEYQEVEEWIQQGDFARAGGWLLRKARSFWQDGVETEARAYKLDQEGKSTVNETLKRFQNSSRVKQEAQRYLQQAAVLAQAIREW